jgi:hypothetical protein
MRGVITGTLWFVLSVMISSCIKQVDVATRNEKPVLVVEGNITTDTIPYTVKLSYSGPAIATNQVPEATYEKEATVTISDEQGQSTALVYTGEGNYQTTDPSFIGQVGHSYQVNIHLKDGTTYLSIPEKIAAPVDIANINVSYTSHFDIYYPSRMDFSVDVQDPAGEENYYKWDFDGWTMRQTHGVPCGFGCVMFEYCYQKQVDKGIKILSDNLINGNQVKNFTVGHSYIYTFGNHFIEISQSSLTREAFQFWQRYNDQLTRTGSILDPLPASIRGNIYNESKPDEFALGYFSASSVTHRRAIVLPYSITQYWLDLSAVQFIPPISVACFDYFPDALVYPPPPARQYPPPPGWENAEQIKVYW